MTTVPVNVDPNTLNKSINFSILVPGTDLYEEARAGKTITLSGGGQTLDANVLQKGVGPLVLMIGQYGPQHYSTQGRMYDVSTVGDALRDEFTDTGATDIGALYTALLVNIPTVISAP